MLIFIALNKSYHFLSWETGGLQKWVVATHVHITAKLQSNVKILARMRQKKNALCTVFRNRYTIIIDPLHHAFNAYLGSTWQHLPKWCWQQLGYKSTAKGWARTVSITNNLKVSLHAMGLVRSLQIHVHDAERKYCTCRLQRILTLSKMTALHASDPNPCWWQCLSMLLVAYWEATHQESTTRRIDINI